ncbi:glutamate racemase [Patescibacteria group bacterium]|nr:glutamate racemase [Patescibacteria group bacterium]
MIKKIAIFDSGLGGLTVAKQIYKYFPEYSVVYFGDTARVPYGGRSNNIIKRYAQENVDFLISKGAGLVVIGCNSASAVAYSHLKSVYDIPIVDIIQPGTQSALRLSCNRKIGVIGTLATINSGAHKSFLEGLSPGVKVYVKACPLLVSLAENEGLSQKIVDSILLEYIDPIVKKGIDTLILGCTHYPHFIKDIVRLFPNLNLVDPGEQVAINLKAMFESHLKLNDSLEKNGKKEFYVSDRAQNFANICSRFLGIKARVGVDNVFII